MEAHIQKAFDYVSGLTKQLITLSTSIIALTVTFSKEILGAVEGAYQYLLLGSWLFFIISIIYGILTLMALTGNLDPIPKKQVNDKDGNEQADIKVAPNLTITSPNILGSSKWQMFTFAFALILALAYGFFAVVNPKPKKQDNNTFIIIDKSKSLNDSLVKSDTLFVIKKE